MSLSLPRYHTSYWSNADKKLALEARLAGKTYLEIAKLLTEQRRKIYGHGKFEPVSRDAVSGHFTRMKRLAERDPGLAASLPCCSGDTPG